MGNKYDFVVIGSGPGGYIAAIRAAQLGYSVAIIEKEGGLGGVCLNWGCIPTKSLLKSAEIFKKIKEAESFGIKINGNIEPDISAIVERSRKAVSKLGTGVRTLMKKYNITVNRGFARLLGNREITLESERDTLKLLANHIILATGSSFRTIPGIDSDLFWTAKEAMVPQSLPKSLMIVGSGAIGIEFASFYSTLGSEVTIVEMQERILPMEDNEISQAMHRALSTKGIKILTKSSLVEAKKTGSAIEAKISSEKGTETITCERAIAAIGVCPNTKELGLENTKAKLNSNGFIEVDDSCSTEEPGLYAIGDVAGPPCLAHKASHEAVICVEKIAEIDGALRRPAAHVLSRNNIPNCTYSIPQIASVGLTEEQARAQGLDIKVGVSRASCNGKAIVSGSEDGFVKVILDAKSGELLGAHMIGEEVTEMINGYVVARQIEATDLDITSAVFPHPTLSEMMHEAVLTALGEPQSS